MATQGAITVIVTGGAPAATLSGAISDGTYTIGIGTDNAGVSIAVNTPYGGIGGSGLQRGGNFE